MQRPAGKSQERCSQHWPWATTGLITLTLAAYLLQHLHPHGISGSIAQWGCTPSLMTTGEPLPGTVLPACLGLLTALFLHVSWTHVGANMAILLAVGLGLERALGTGRFLALYLISGLLGNLAVVLTHPSVAKASCGASVAVAGVWAAWLLCPQACLGATLRLGRAALDWQRYLRSVVLVAIVFALLAAGWGWFGFKLWAAVSGAGWRVFWSRSFCAHLFGAAVGCGVLGWSLLSQHCKERFEPGQSKLKKG